MQMEPLCTETSALRSRVVGSRAGPGDPAEANKGRGPGDLSTCQTLRPYKERTVWGRRPPFPMRKLHISASRPKAGMCALEVSACEALTN